MGVSIGIAVISYKGDIMLSINIDDTVCGYNGAKMFKECMKQVLKEQNCLIDE